MQKTAERIEALLKAGTKVFMHASDEELSRKTSPEKWSKREILGHLIDSALHNLVRFTEARYSPLPYLHRPYDQDALVRINDYQNQDSEDLLVLWLSLNKRIASVMSITTESESEIPVKFSDGTVKNLRFLMTYYADHLAWHLRKIDPALEIR